MGGHPAHRWGTAATLRSTSWDGPPPAVGDLLVTRAGSWYVVERAAEGAGPGHYRLDVTRIPPPDPDDVAGQVFAWSWSPRRRVPA